MKNPLLIFIVGLIVGLGGGYLLFHRNQAEFSFTDNSVSEKFKQFYLDESFGLKGDRTSHPIDPERARTLINAYRAQNKRAIFPLRTIDDSLLNGYYIDRGPLDTILMDKSFTGVSFYIAKNDSAYTVGKTNRTFTLVYMGAKAIPGTNQYSNIDANGNTSVAYDFIQPCPPYCGNFLETAAKDKKK